MPKITLNQEVLEGFNSSTIESVLSYMQSIAEENENLNNTIHIIMQNLYKASQDNTKNPSEREIRLNQAKEYWCFLYGLVLNEELLATINEEVLKTFIQGALEDASRAKSLKAFIEKLKKEETIELPLLATFHFTLKLEFERMQKTANQSLPEKQMIEKLMLALEPVVLSNREELQRLFYFCNSMYDYTPNLDVRSDDVKQGKVGELLLSEDHSRRCLQSLEKISKLRPEIISKYMKALNEYWERDFLSSVRKVKTTPVCYVLDLNNYHFYRFDTLYYMANFYQKLKKEQSELKLKEVREWEALQQETEKCIEENKSLSAQKRNIHKNMEKEINEEQTMLQTKKPPLGVENLKDINKAHLETLLALYNVKQGKIIFSNFEMAIKALGGNVKNFDGSRTRIVLPNLNKSNVSELVGGFDKPHKASDPLHYIQVRLICKALERAGITKAVVEAAIALKAKEQQGSVQSSSKGRGKDLKAEMTETENSERQSANEPIKKENYNKKR